MGYAPSTLDNYRAGDLRLASAWHTYSYNFGGLVSGNNSDRPNTQIFSKYATTNVHFWRRAMVYLHLAEVLDRVGMPQFAYRILATGVNNNVIDSLKRAYPAESAYLSQFDFPNTQYVLRTDNPTAFTTIGVHSRGSGFSEYNEFYTMPTGTIDEQVEAVEDMIVDEEALEMAFKGQRYYDLMRVALRRGDPSYLANRVMARQGSSTAISVSLLDTNNWYLSWGGKLGVR